MLVARRSDPAPPACDFRVAVLCSRRAPGLAQVLPGGGSSRIVAVVTSDPACEELSCLRTARIPALVHDIRAFHGDWGARLTDLAVRPAYDRLTAELLAPFRPDLVVLCGYLHILTAPMLEAFPERVLNIHDADLAIRGPDGRPAYRGLRSTRDAVFAGEPDTRSTVHLVTGEVDVGPVLVRSWAFPTHPLVADARAWGATDILKAYAYAQREWMMRAAWGPLLARTIELFARDEVRFLDGRAVVGGVLGPRELAPDAPARPRAALSGRGD